MKCGLFAVAFVAIAASASAGKTADPLANVHNIVVVSALGNDVSWQYVDFFDTSNKNDRYLTYHADWKLDEAVTKSAVEALKSRFAIIDEPVSADLLQGLLLVTSEKVSAELQARFASISPMEGVDAYVIIHPKQTHQGILSSSIPTYGLGVKRVLGNFNMVFVNTNADFLVSVVDARTGKVLSFGLAQQPNQEGNFLTGPIPPWEECDKSIWADDPGQLTALQKQQINDAFHTLAVKSLPYALAAAKLIPRIKEDVDIKEWEGRPSVCHFG